MIRMSRYCAWGQAIERQIAVDAESGVPDEHLMKADEQLTRHAERCEECLERYDILLEQADDVDVYYGVKPPKRWYDHGVELWGGDYL